MPRRRDRTTGAGLVDVSIEESEDATDARWVRGREDPGGRRRRLRPVHRWLLGGLSVVAVVVLTAVWVTADADERREEADRRAALADVPGVLDSLDEPLRVLWSVQEVRDVIVDTDDVVVLGTGDDAAVALDAVTGEVLWRHEGGHDESCKALAGGSEGDAARPEVICWVSTDIVQAEGPLAVPPSDVVVLDASTGVEVDAYEVTGTLLAVEPLDGYALIASVDAAGAVVVERWAPGRGVLWSITEPGLLAQIQDEGLVFRTEEDLFWVGGLDARGRSVATGALATGEVPLPGPLYAGTVRLADGGWARWDVTDALASRFWTTVTDGDGTPRFEIAGLPWVDDGGVLGSAAHPIVTDGLPAGLLLMRLDVGISGSGHVAGVDAVTGAVRWEGDRLAGVAPCVQVGGVLVAAGAGRVLALDVATGRQLWAGRAGKGAAGVSITDGERIVLPTDVGDGPALTSFDIASGATGWTVVLAEEPRDLTALGDRLVLMLTEGHDQRVGYTVSVLG